MDPDELAGWREGTVPACEACPLGFAASMREIDRCNGTPAGSEEGAHIVAAHLTVVAPPCETCAHAPVCRIRANIVGLERYELTAPDNAPELDRALTVVATATVECSFYLRARPAGTARPKAASAGPDWTPERRARQSELTRARNLARAEAKAAAAT
ncbi:MAG: hypothetical protein ACYDCI_05670 [Candidatus Limnocylindrales bacterium]